MPGRVKRSTLAGQKVKPGSIGSCRRYDAGRFSVAAGRAMWIAALSLLAWQRAAGTTWAPMKCRALFPVEFPGRGQPMPCSCRRDDDGRFLAAFFLAITRVPVWL